MLFMANLTKVLFSQAVGREFESLHPLQ